MAAYQSELDELIDQYPLKRINSQIYVGPPAWYNGEEPGKYTEIFIGNLPNTITVKNVLELVLPFGIVYQLRLPTTHVEPKGYAYVRFITQLSATLAINGLNGKMFGSKLLKVERSWDARQLQILNWPTNWTVETSTYILKSKLSNVVKIEMSPDVINNRPNKGYVIVEFTSHNAAAVGRREIKQNVLEEVTGTVHNVQWVRCDFDISEDQFRHVKDLFIGNIPKNTNVRQLKEALSQVLPLPTYIKSHPDGYAFIFFNTHEEAEKKLLELKAASIVLGNQLLQFHWVKGKKPFKKAVDEFATEQPLPSRCAADLRTHESQSASVAAIPPQQRRAITRAEDSGPLPSFHALESLRAGYLDSSRQKLQSDRINPIALDSLQSFSFDSDILREPKSPWDFQSLEQAARTTANVLARSTDSPLSLSPETADIAFQGKKPDQISSTPSACLDSHGSARTRPLPSRCAADLRTYQLDRSFNSSEFYRNKLKNQPPQKYEEFLSSNTSPENQIDSARTGHLIVTGEETTRTKPLPEHNYQFIKQAVRATPNITAFPRNSSSYSPMSTSPEPSEIPPGLENIFSSTTPYQDPNGFARIRQLQSLTGDNYRNMPDPTRDEVLPQISHFSSLQGAVTSIWSTQGPHMSTAFLSRDNQQTTRMPPAPPIWSGITNPAVQRATDDTRMQDSSVQKPRPFGDSQDSGYGH